MSRDALAEFLRDRREALSPGPANGARASASGRRRTPGLRREEVADLAHISVDYYVRLEQARGPRPSATVLSGLAEALRLAAPERDHLFRLAEVLPQPPASPPHEVRPHVARLLDRLPYTAAFVTAADYDVLAANLLAHSLLGGLDEPNLARRRFLQHDELLTVGHEEFAEYATARLRASADRYPQDPYLTALLADLHAGSAEFRRLWDSNPVSAPGHRTKTMLHPDLGRLEINCDILSIPEDDQQVVFMTAEPDTPTGKAFEHLSRASSRVSHPHLADAPSASGGQGGDVARLGGVLDGQVGVQRGGRSDAGSR